MNRYLMVLAATGFLGIAVGVSVPIATYARLRNAELAAPDTLLAVGKAQATFRRNGGHGGYATDLASLRTPCPEPSASQSALSPPTVKETGTVFDVPPGYVLSLRAARDARPGGLDCHGRATSSDFYAALAPRGPLDGRQAMAMLSWGRIYVFFDGIAPLESDMGMRGLAVPLDQLEGFKIP
jgi:hypothetical protein